MTENERLEWIKVLRAPHPISLLQQRKLAKALERDQAEHKKKT